MQKDRWDRPDNALNFGNPAFTAVAWDSAGTPGVIYLRGDYADNCWIKRISTNTGEISWAFGAWSSRTSLNYGTDRKE